MFTVEEKRDSTTGLTRLRSSMVGTFRTVGLTLRSEAAFRPTWRCWSHMRKAACTARGAPRACLLLEGPVEVLPECPDGRTSCSAHNAPEASPA
jgi:hypothetical protein